MHVRLGIDAFADSHPAHPMLKQHDVVVSTPQIRPQHNTHIRTCGFHLREELECFLRAGHGLHVDASGHALRGCRIEDS